jgi:hypothetical protein
MCTGPDHAHCKPAGQSTAPVADAPSTDVRTEWVGFLKCLFLVVMAVECCRVFAPSDVPSPVGDTFVGPYAFKVRPLPTCIDEPPTITYLIQCCTMSVFAIAHTRVHPVLFVHCACIQVVIAFAALNDLARIMEPSPLPTPTARRDFNHTSPIYAALARVQDAKRARERRCLAPLDHNSNVPTLQGALFRAGSRRHPPPSCASRRAELVHKVLAWEFAAHKALLKSRPVEVIRHEICSVLRAANATHTFTVWVRLDSAQEFQVVTTRHAHVSELFAAVAGMSAVNISALHLTYGGKRLQLGNTLESYGIITDSQLHLHLALKGGAPLTCVACGGPTRSSSDSRARECCDETCTTRHGAASCFLCLREGVESDTCANCSFCFGHRGDMRADLTGHLSHCQLYNPGRPNDKRPASTSSSPLLSGAGAASSAASAFPSPSKRARTTRTSEKAYARTTRKSTSTTRKSAKASSPKNCATPGCGREGRNTFTCSRCACTGHIGDSGADSAGHTPDCVHFEVIAEMCLCGYLPTDAADRLDHNRICSTQSVPTIPIIGNTSAHAAGATHAFNEGPGHSVCIFCNTIIRLVQPDAPIFTVHHDSNPPSQTFVDRLSPPPTAGLPPLCELYYTTSATDVHPAWQTLMLSPEPGAVNAPAADEPGSFSSFNACSSCHKALLSHDASTPKFAIARGFWSVPMSAVAMTEDVLRDATDAEIALVSLFVPRSQYVSPASLHLQTNTLSIEPAVLPRPFDSPKRTS